ncbi:hypothetical protein [Dyadobacter tibetensis]|uniref:hypothetical protein n=1 Tax=Dyadobacter tibetensis TaxID=1211851 RepID=UPI0010E6F4D3|nr:hypothetical protein [Dyadobacter tibetensis]
MAIDTISISVNDSMPTVYDKVQIAKDKYLIGRSKKNYRLDIYDLEVGKFIKSIIIDKNFVPNMVSFYVYTMDSIFVAQDPYTISLVNSSGNVINKWVLDNAPINWKLDEIINTPLYYFDTDRENINFFDPKTGNIHLTLTNTDIYYFSDREKFKLHNTFNIHTKKWGIPFGKIEAAYSGDSEREKQYLPFQSHPFCVVLGDSSFVSYPMSHKVSIYNNKTGLLLNENCVSSKYIEKLPPPIDYETNPQTERNFFVSTSLYGSLNYHNKLGVFSRIALHEQPEKLPSGKLNSHLNKTVSVILFNKKLEKLDEFILDRESQLSSFGDPQSLFVSYPTSNGFIGALKERVVTSESEFRHSIRFKFLKK